MQDDRTYRNNIPAARRLRREQTSTEAILWRFLRRERFMGLKFRRQHAARQYVIDFYCPELRLAIEIDGNVHDDEDQQALDRERQETLEHDGFRFFRITAAAVESDMHSVLRRLRRCVEELHPEVRRGEP